ncbi:MAG TPA: hypothetical protein VF705_10775, partial [Longimicrobium sp.]
MIRALAEYEEWLEHSRSGMSFFPDFTDHGIGHLQAVLDLSEALVADGSHGRPNTWAVLTPGDAATLVLATLAHDVGMHLTPDGFLALVASSAEAPTIPDFDKKLWPQLWEEFLGEARRWDGKTLKRIFGEAVTTRPNSRPAVRRPPENPEYWDKLDLRLIGEFARRHHPRIAHEIALAGWPASSGDSPPPLKLDLTGEFSELADLAGLVARSHGLELRDTLGYLAKHHFNTL